MSKKNSGLSQVKSKGFVKGWGSLKLLLSQVVFYATILNLLMLSATSYNTTIRDWSKTYLGFEINFLVFLAIILLFLLAALIFEYKVTLPGFYSFHNEQQYKHDNPIRRDIAEVLEEVKRGNMSRAERIKENLIIQVTNADIMQREIYPDLLKVALKNNVIGIGTLHDMVIFEFSTAEDKEAFEVSINDKYNKTGN